MVTKRINLGDTAKRASKIRERQHKEWQRIFNACKGDYSKIKHEAAAFRKKYGATPAKRWQNALREAAKHNKDTQQSLRLK